jgi:16S rRNA (cytidine1402-2'-O)-methyltransferase
VTASATLPAPSAGEPDGAGCLYLVPTPLGSDDDPGRVLPPSTLQALVRLDYLIAENAKSARAVLARLSMQKPVQQIEIRELNLRTPAERLPDLLAPILAGRDAGLLSEAGCPAIADPGAALVEIAHQKGIKIVPLIGPSSILLALMASGMNGQRFAFIGYAPVPDDERADRLRALEQRSARENETQVLIETPYRNQALFDAMLRTLAPTTMLAVASDLSLPGEQVVSRSVAQWRKLSTALARVPTVFVLQATASNRPHATPGRARQRNSDAPRRGRRPG